MSEKSLLAFCEKLNSSLLAQGGTNFYRDLVANKRVHVFKFSVSEMIKQAEIELEAPKNNLVLTPEDRAVIGRLAEQMKKDLHTSLSKLAKNYGNFRYKTTPDTISFRFDSSVGTQQVITFGRTGFKIYPDNVFYKVKLAYQPTLKKFFNQLQEHLKSTVEVNPETGRMRNRTLRTAKGRTSEGVGRFFNAGHEKGAGIFESFLRDAFEGIANSERLDSEATAQDLAKVLKVESLITVIRSDKEDSHTIGIESDYLNKYSEEGGTKVSAVKAQLNKQLKAAIAKLEKSIDTRVGLVGLQGSDSIDTKKKKKILRNIAEPFKKLKNVKVVTEDTKLNSKSSSTKKPTVSSGTKGVSAAKLGAGVRAARIKRRPARASESPASYPLKLIGIINAQLPSTLQKNMMVPRLENRSGRFANSVEVTDITKTPKGYPSIGYTYQKFPYQTFEPGFKQGSVERDPRKLIDTSIREIAAKLAIGRFYTRRL